MSLRIFELTKLGVMIDHNDIINFMGFEHKIAYIPMTCNIDKCKIVSFGWRRAIDIKQQKTNIPVIELLENNKTRECMSKDINPNGTTLWAPNYKVLINARYGNTQESDKSENEMSNENKSESYTIDYEYEKFEVNSVSALTDTDLFHNLFVIIDNKPSKASELSVMQLIRNLDKLYIRKELSLEAKLTKFIQKDPDLSSLKDDPFINTLIQRNNAELSSISKLIHFIQSNR